MLPLSAYGLKSFSLTESWPDFWTRFLIMAKSSYICTCLKKKKTLIAGHFLKSSTAFLSSEQNVKLSTFRKIGNIRIKHILDILKYRYCQSKETFKGNIKLRQHCFDKLEVCFFVTAVLIICIVSQLYYNSIYCSILWSVQKLKFFHFLLTFFLVC